MTKSQLIAALAIAEARIGVLESKLEVARTCYVQQRTTIASLEGQLANKAEAKPKAAWAPSARLLAAKAQAMANGRCVKA